LAFERRHGRERLRCTFNLSSKAVAWTAAGTPIASVGDCANSALGGYAAIIEDLA
jgi:hypothetical protein